MLKYFPSQLSMKKLNKNFNLDYNSEREIKQRKMLCERLHKIVCKKKAHSMLSIFFSNFSAHTKHDFFAYD